MFIKGKKIKTKEDKTEMGEKETKLRAWRFSSGCIWEKRKNCVYGSLAAAQKVGQSIEKKSKIGLKIYGLGLCFKCLLLIFFPKKCSFPCPWGVFSCVENKKFINKIIDMLAGLSNTVGVCRCQTRVWHKHLAMLGVSVLYSSRELVERYCEKAPFFC